MDVVDPHFDLAVTSGLCGDGSSMRSWLWGSCQMEACDSVVREDFQRTLIRNEKAAQRLSFGAGYPADVHADIPADVRGQKLWSGPGNPGKTSISVRTSMTRRRGRPRPEGGERKLRSEKLRAEFSFPS